MHVECAARARVAMFRVRRRTGAHRQPGNGVSTNGECAPARHLAVAATKAHHLGLLLEAVHVDDVWVLRELKLRVRDPARLRRRDEMSAVLSYIPAQVHPRPLRYREQLLHVHGSAGRVHVPVGVRPGAAWPVCWGSACASSNELDGSARPIRRNRRQTARRAGDR